DGQGHGRHPHGHELQCRLCGGELPQKRHRHGNGPPAVQRGLHQWPQARTDCQNRTRRSDSRARPHPHGVRRHHGGAWRFGGGGGQCRRAGPAKAHD
ncbi:Pyruvate kinase, partial [Daphnia magna]